MCTFLLESPQTFLDGALRVVYSCCRYKFSHEHSIWAQHSVLLRSSASKVWLKGEVTTSANPKGGFESGNTNSPSAGHVPAAHASSCSRSGSAIALFLRELAKTSEASVFFCVSERLPYAEGLGCFKQLCRGEKGGFDRRRVPGQNCCSSS